MTRLTLIQRIGEALARSGFRRRASLIILLAFSFFAVVMGVISPWLATEVYVSNEVEQGEQIATLFAQSSTLALLYHSAANGKEPAERTLSFPGVMYVAIYDDADHLIREDGVLPDNWHPNDAGRTKWSGTVVAYETREYWHIIAPVISGGATARDSPFVVTPTQSEYIGYVQVVRSKASLIHLRKDLIGYIMVLTAFALILTLAILVPMMNRLLRPVHELSETLEHAGVDPTPIRLPEQGPPEIVKMGKAFNRLMALLEAKDKSLREHSQMLESEVHLRTQEFLQARDVALSASRHKSEFLATVSHELRTPLQAIIGYTEGALIELQASESAQLVSDLQIVLRAADQLLALINDILDLAKIEAGRMDLVREEIELKSFLEEIRNIIAPLARRSQNVFQMTIRSDFGKPLVDRGKLRQILLNLLSNACKFTQNGEVWLTVMSTRTSLIFIVTDTGVGIAPEDQKYIFDAFHQVDMSATRHHGGTGLGLAICQQLCKQMGGAIVVESALGKGTRFTVTIPLTTEF
ncbi:MAG: sensor histidine kinase [Sulfuricaulis sp.]